MWPVAKIIQFALNLSLVSGQRLQQQGSLWSADVSGVTLSQPVVSKTNAALVFFYWLMF